MTVAMYRNRLNAEMKRFGNFTKRISNDLTALGIQSYIVFDDNKYRCLAQMKLYDTLIFVSHGRADTIYHKYDHINENHQPLINLDNCDILSEKKVIAISCGTAKKLGNYACNKGHCKVYLGFFHKIHFDKVNKKKPSKKYIAFLTICYKECFSETIERAIVERWSFNKFKLFLKQKLQETVVNRANALSMSKPKFYKYHGIDQAVLAVMNVSDNIIIYGNPSEIVG